MPKKEKMLERRDWCPTLGRAPTLGDCAAPPWWGVKGGGGLLGITMLRQASLCSVRHHCAPFLLLLLSNVSFDSPLMARPILF